MKTLTSWSIIRLRRCSNALHNYTDLFGKAGMTFLHSLPLPENYKIALEGYLFVLETVRHEIGGASKRVQQLAEDDQDSMLLMTIPGVGYYSTLLIKSEIGDVKRFPSVKQLCSYTGLVSLTHASGNVCYHTHITKQGSRWLRWILIEAAIHAVKRPGALRRFYFKVERKKGGQIAKVATARKLLEWIYHILKDGTSFQEVANVVEAMGKGEPVNLSDKVSVFRDNRLLGHNRIDCLSVLSIHIAFIANIP